MESEKTCFNKIISRYLQGLHSREDANTIIQNLADKDMRHTMEREMDAHWAELSDEDSLSKSEYEKNKKEAYELLRKIQNPKPKININQIMRYAAIFIVAVLCVGGGKHLLTSVNRQSISYTELTVDKGTQKQITLVDGTQVILNSGSYIKYPNEFVDDERIIEVNGEAFFEVAKDPDKPFIVRMKDANIKVLGTSFNIKGYETDEQLKISLKTGKVQIDMPEAMVCLIPGEEMILDKKNGDISKHKENPDKTTSWIHGGLYFNKTPIKSAINELSRIYNQDITFAAGQDFTEVIYGEHDNNSLEDVLNSIEYATGIKHRKSGNQIILYKE